MNAVPALDHSLRTSRVRTDGDRLIAGTGLIERIWQWTGAGFATREILEINSKRCWSGSGGDCDWQLPDGREPANAKLLSLVAVTGNDDGFTSEHVCVTAEIAYPDDGLVLRWIVWAYPDAPGLRTQLSVRLADSRSEPPTVNSMWTPVAACVERVPVDDRSCRRRFFGYYNCTQQRNDTHLAILQEAVNAHRLLGREWCDWASVACLENDAGGIALVKESHKCVNQKGHATGGFICDEAAGLTCTGWGVLPGEISEASFTSGWATWCIVWSGAEFEQQTAFKTFDRIRFPGDPARDIYIQANTWGSTDCGTAARRAAGEASVLQEIETCAELGIDVLQIDDGWQVPPGHSTWDPGVAGWHPHPASYPAGWNRVRQRAAELGVKLGLWAAAQPITPAELRKNHEAGGFVQYKLDFAHLKTRRDIDDLMDKVREFIRWAGHRVRVNWDVTENPARYGYFFGREYGSIYLENRKPVLPRGVVYRPHTVLRDLWQVAKYLDLHQFQCSIQDVDRVDREHSDAHLHSHVYAVAIALMGIPLFFLETKYYSAAAKAQIKSLLAEYRRHQAALFRGIVYPIGSKPNNASWTGFQCHNAAERAGYLTVFRERCNPRHEKSLNLFGARPGTIRITDLIGGTKRDLKIGADGSVSLQIPAAPGFLFLSYTYS